MLADAAEPAGLDDGHPVARPHDAQPMGHDDDGLARREVGDGGVDLQLVLGIGRARGLVEG